MKSCDTCLHFYKPLSGPDCSGCYRTKDKRGHTKATVNEQLAETRVNVPSPLLSTLNYLRDAGVTPVVAGRKDDSGKLDMTLLSDDLPHALEAVCEVLQWAIKDKGPVPYERGSWQGVPDFQRRYRGAMLRHISDGSKSAKSEGVPFERTRDWETGKLQLAHIALDALFQLEMVLRDLKEASEQHEA